MLLTQGLRKLPAGLWNLKEAHFGKSGLQYSVEAEIEPNPGSTAMTGRVPLVKNISLFHPKLIEYAIPPISTPPSPKSPRLHTIQKLV